MRFSIDIIYINSIFLSVALYTMRDRIFNTDSRGKYEMEPRNRMLKISLQVRIRISRIESCFLEKPPVSQERLATVYQIPNCAKYVKDESFLIDANSTVVRIHSYILYYGYQNRF